MSPIRVAELHAFLADFPIALLVASVLLDFAAVIFRRASLVDGASWALLLGAPMTLLAAASGWWAERRAAITVPDVAHAHKVVAAVTAAIFIILFLARLSWLFSRLIGWLRLGFPRSRLLERTALWTATRLPSIYIKRLPGWAVACYLLLSAAGVVLLGVTVVLGERMVYGYGIGVPGH